MTSLLARPLNQMFDMGNLDSDADYIGFKSLLLKFLGQSDQYLMYPLKEARIINFYPLRISDDDGQTYLEISNLEDEIKDRFRQHQIDYDDGEFKLVLIEWEFMYRRVPNSTDYYFDIKANKYRIEELEEDEEFDFEQNGICITEDLDISIAMGDRQRRQLHKEFKQTRENLGILSITPIQNKTKKTFMTYNKELPDLSPSQNSDIFALDDMSNIDYTSASNSQGSESHFMNIMRVEQLVDADKKDLVTKIPTIDDNLPPSPSVWNINTPSGSENAGRVKKGIFSGAKKRGFGFNNLSLLGKREFNQPSSKPVAFRDITQAIMNGDVKWEELSFDPKHIDFLKNNKKMLTESQVDLQF